MNSYSGPGGGVVFCWRNIELGKINDLADDAGAAVDILMIPHIVETVTSAGCARKN